MTITRRPTRSTSVRGGSVELPENPCVHGPAQLAEPWEGAAGTAGTATVVGAGKMGLPLAAQFASHGWNVIAVDIDAAVVASINAGHSHLPGEPGLVERIAEAHAAGRLAATTDALAAARASDVVVLIVPVVLDDASRPDYRNMDHAVASIAPGLRPGVTVIFETTLPVGDTRERYVPALESPSGLSVEDDLFVAFSPERLYTGAVFKNLATYPKLVGGVGPRSTDRAASFYASVVDAEVVAMSSSEAAELSKLADTTYRYVNIAFANQLADYSRESGVDVREVIEAANSQPYSHIHQPGLGVGGHCIPVYPHFILSRAPDFSLIDLSQRINDGRVDIAVESLRQELDGLSAVSILVLGLTYREGVKETAYSRALPLMQRLADAGARVSAWDPLLSEREVEALGVRPWSWASASDAEAIVLQTADPAFGDLDPEWFPAIKVLFDGRNAHVDDALWDRIRVLGVGVPPKGQAAKPLAAHAAGETR